MSDYGLFLDDSGLIDIAFVPGDVAADDGLETAVLISLFSDARAALEQIEPTDRDGNQRGFWGDLGSDDSTGSLLWTMKRKKQLQSVLAQAHGFVRDALAWMIDDKVAERIDVSVSYPAIGWMLIVVAIYRPRSNNPVVYRFNYQWQAQILKVAN